MKLSNNSEKGLEKSKIFQRKVAKFGIAVLLLVGLVASAFAFPGLGFRSNEAVEEAIEAGDYNAWKELMSGKGRVTQVITEANFARFAEAHRLAEEGKLDEAEQIRQELGLGLGNRHGDGSGQGSEGQGQHRGWDQ